MNNVYVAVYDSTVEQNSSSYNNTVIDLELLISQLQNREKTIFFWFNLKIIHIFSCNDYNELITDISRVLFCKRKISYFLHSKNKVSQ